MAQTKTPTFIHEIESLVSDELQVVSYKWLSRNYMVSANEAKRVLQEFVQKHEGELEVVYALSGWLKSKDPTDHQTRLVTGPKLAEAQQEFDGDCSVQVYSVQASMPKDKALLWNAEFVQAEELFKQPSTVDNCLRDNRFCEITNSFVRRKVDGSRVVSAAPQSKSAVGEGPTKTNTVQKSPKSIARDSIDKVDAKPQNVIQEVKSESNGIGNTVALDNINKPTTEKEKALPLPTGKKKVPADKSGSVARGSLASFWSCASAKPKPCTSSVENNNTVSNPAVSTENAQTACEEECDSGIDDNQNVSVRRSSSRKRRVVFDFSDEDEDDDDVVNLASPDFPNKQSSEDSSQDDKNTSEKTTLNFDLQEENKSRVKEERETDQKAHLPLGGNVSAISKCTNTGKSSSEKLESCAPEARVNKGSVNNAAPCSPKRRKVMKTRIDERGREVVEVVWEGEETEVKKPDKVTTKNTDSKTNAANSAPATKKPPANSHANNGKGGNKKAGNKDPKQGNLLSFFKKV
ncbi:uncharacterized protein LOC114183515 [Vigna unguiculata]|uniref:uncharacterized protein LOC114183515 n=1 Tax=Vigna unguiculata TaxID=3917 RepID=UPI001015D4D3|nr:uncharacterized protein LOC114183515 [Vigna unguiculata]